MGELRSRRGSGGSWRSAYAQRWRCCNLDPRRRRALRRGLGRPARCPRRVTDTPLLAKGFFTDEQTTSPPRVRLVPHAILLLLRDLDDDTTTARLMQQSQRRRGSTRSSRRMTPKELARAIALGADPIGINARNLATFEIERRCTQLSLIADARSRVARRASWWPRAASGVERKERALNSPAPTPSSWAHR